MIKKAQFVLFLLIFFPIFVLSKEKASLDTSLKKELLGKVFQTKRPLGVTYSFQDGEGYSVKLNVVTEIHGEEIKYYAEGGLKIASQKKWDGSSVLTPKIYSGKYVSLNEIEVIPEGTIIQVKKIRIMPNQLELKIEIPGGQDAKLRLTMLENFDLEGIMNKIADFLKIDYIESLKSLVSKKQEAEKRLKEAISIEDKFKSLFEMKQAIEAILKIEGLGSEIYSKYLKENTEIDSEIQELYEVLKEPVIIVESIVLEPEVAKKGDALNLELKYKLVTPKEKKIFKVIESVVLSGKDIILTLKKRESERTEGEHLFSLQFVIPMDLEPGEHTLITTIEVGEKKKIVSKRFSLIGSISSGEQRKTVRGSFELESEAITQKKKGITEDIESVVVGVVAFDSNKKIYIQPLVEYKNGEFYSLFHYFDSEEAKKIKPLLQKTKTFWLYKEGTLVGHFEATKIVPGMVYADAGGDHIIVAGKASWEKGYIPRMEEDVGGNLTVLKDIVALNQSVTQRPFSLRKEFLNKEQTLKLDELLHSTLKNASVPLVKSGYKGVRQVVGKAPNSYSDKVMDLDNDSQPEVYLTAFWEGPEYTGIIMYVLATWTGNNWKYIRHSTYESESESLPTVGDVPFSPEAIVDIDGDGIVELILEERTGYEVYKLTLYRIHNKRLEKVLDIGGYGL